MLTTRQRKTVEEVRQRNQYRIQRRKANVRAGLVGNSKRKMRPPLFKDTLLLLEIIDDVCRREESD